MRKAGLFIAIALMALPGTALAQQGSSVDAEIANVGAKWQAAFNAGDGAAIGALYSDDASLLPPNSAPINGGEAITAFWSEAVGQGATTELTSKEVYSMGDMAVEVGMYSGTNADGSHQDHGHFTVIYKKVDGKWMMYRDMWNSDMSQ
jgi:uncharacterized protein (TIGR02246 family)